MKTCLKTTLVALLTIGGYLAQAQPIAIEGSQSSTYARGDVRNGDGVTGLAAGWESLTPAGKIPQVRADLIKQLEAELKGVKADPNFTYPGNFAAEDALAFHILEANLYLRYQAAADATRKFGKIFSRAVPTIAHFNEKRPEHSALAYETYREGLKKAAEEVIAALDPKSALNEPHSAFVRLNPQPGESIVLQAAWEEIDSKRTNSDGRYTYVRDYILRSGTKGDQGPELCRFQTDSNVNGYEGRAGRMALARDCGLAEASRASLSELAANYCVSETCILEVFSVARELLDISSRLDRKYNLESAPQGQTHIFYDPKHSTMRSALTKYIESSVINQNTNLFASAALGLMNLAYIPVAFSLDALVNTRLILTSLSFRTKHFAHLKYDRKRLREDFESMAKNRLTENMNK